MFNKNDIWCADGIIPSYEVKTIGICTMCKKSVVDCVCWIGAVDVNHKEVEETLLIEGCK